MKKYEIKDENLTYAVLIRDEDWEQGLNFISLNEDYQQVGIWRYKKGEKLLPHIHLYAPREVSRTQEVIFVKKGRVRADIYTEEDILFKSVELKKGDTLILLNGGHGYEILEDDAMVLEVKNGPYVGAEKDRRRIT